MKNEASIRPTKKQRELLSYIEQFIAEHGYSPSYREIMNGLNYTSVATVSLHINSLIRRGHLRKRDRSARSLEVVRMNAAGQPADVPDRAASETCACGHFTDYFLGIESASTPDKAKLEDADTLVRSLEIAGCPEASVFRERLDILMIREARDSGER